MRSFRRADPAQDDVEFVVGEWPFAALDARQHRRTPFKPFGKLVLFELRLLAQGSEMLSNGGVAAHDQSPLIGRSYATTIPLLQETLLQYFKESDACLTELILRWNIRHQVASIGRPLSRPLTPRPPSGPARRR
ncbi:hypothetical protein [Bradyrhizobium sp. SSUT77]|uniref:hypothetical protein n=1 Tax=Bradyrhizobium sp. SSUT77 TaxID=3040603 RepID=UPI002449539C|nr:hypothetical protein [Bradyrhizobium sp. SSUT77]MDH2340840.1 hypothetical protein [Bradyrhizobium sp. SSUT77]